jgi:hypothetical protein
VDVIAHEAVAIDEEAEAAGLLPEKAEVSAAVVVHEEDVLAIVPALRDVVRTAWHDDSR